MAKLAWHGKRQLRFHYIDGYETEITTALVPSPDWDIVLGRPWLRRVNPEVDWKDLKVTHF